MVMEILGELLFEVLGSAFIVIIVGGVAIFIRGTAKSEHFSAAKYIPAVIAGIVTIFLVVIAVALVFNMEIDQSGDWGDLSLVFGWMIRLFFIVLALISGVVTFTLYWSAIKTKPNKTKE